MSDKIQMDALCASSGGVRAHGDTDDFMRHLMRSLLGESEYSAWTGAESMRQQFYDSKRLPSGSCKERGDIFVRKF